MKISYNWLKQFIPLDWSPDRTGALLTDLGLEVEGIETFESVRGSLQGILVGEVLSCSKHPNADNLKITKVSLGPLESDTVQIVCGAPNVAQGQKVPVATIGTTLYDQKGESWKIKKGKIRGEESYGMICAEDEIGIGTSHEGILVLDTTLKPGTPLAEVFTIENDSVFEIGLTPNRADAMSHWGVARDLKAGLLNQKIDLPLTPPVVSEFKAKKGSNPIKVVVKDSTLAPRYCGVTISNLKMQPAPNWMQNRLKAIGIVPKNAVVDITNYVLHELGQPLHAFDTDKIAGNQIRVQRVTKGTKFITLDGMERELHQDDLMICDAEKPMCIAGIFGGAHSGVSEQTREVFLESAYFNTVNTRKSAKRHSLNTDASFRFERGIDPNSCRYALERAALLLCEYAGGTISSDIIDLYPNTFPDFKIQLSFERIDRLIGESLPKQHIQDILQSLDIKIEQSTEAGLEVSVPPYRNDVQREVDVIEEILRVYGYNNIKFSTKLNATIASVPKITNHKLQDVIANQLSSLGFYEMMANSLTSINNSQGIEELDENENITILNPLSQELSVLRQSMMYSALEAVVYNVNRKRSNLKLYEFGKTYRQIQDETLESKKFSITCTGNLQKESWNAPNTTGNFFYIKGVVTSVLERTGITSYKELPTQSSMFTEGLDLVIGNKTVVRLGRIAAKHIKAIGISQDVFYAEFEWDEIEKLQKIGEIKFQSIPKFPEVRRDFALLLDQKVTFKELRELAFKQERKLLKEVQLFDVYEGTNLPEGKKSYAISFRLLDEKKDPYRQANR